MPTTPTPTSGVRPPDASARRALPELPVVGAWSWTLEGLLAVAGVTCADLVHGALGLRGSGALVGAVLAVVLVAHRRADRLRAPLRWFVVVLLGVVAVLLVDDLTEVAAVPLVVSASALAVVLAVVLAAASVTWWSGERATPTRALDPVPRELCCWLVVLLTFGLGTDVTDLLREQVGLGDWSVALLVGVVITAVVTTRVGLGADAAACSWATYLLTRPLGAAVGDGSSQARVAGGLGLGTAWTSAAVLGLVLAGVGLRTAARRGRPPTGPVVDLTEGPTGPSTGDRTVDVTPDALAPRRRTR